MNKNIKDTDSRWFQIQKKRNFAHKKDLSLQKFLKDKKKTRYLERKKSQMSKIKENDEYTTEDITLETLQDWVVVEEKTNTKEMNIKENKSFFQSIIGWFI